MDEYQTSIANVDNALNRLNQTLASYKLFANSSQQSTIAESKSNGKTDAAAHNGSAIQPLQAGIARPATSLDEGKDILHLLLALRSSQQYPEVC